jgi:hypothetical protein
MAKPATTDCASSLPVVVNSSDIAESKREG